MAAIIHPLLTLLASLTRQELARQVAYLKAENRILRSKLLERIVLSNQERRTLVRHGRKLGARIEELISIVSYSTFRRWVRDLEDAPSQRRDLALRREKRLANLWRGFYTAQPFHIGSLKTEMQMEQLRCKSAHQRPATRTCDKCRCPRFFRAWPLLLLGKSSAHESA